jgi:hypothetical protein
MNYSCRNVRNGASRLCFVYWDFFERGADAKTEWLLSQTLGSEEQALNPN